MYVCMHTTAKLLQMLDVMVINKHTKNYRSTILKTVHSAMHSTTQTLPTHYMHLNCRCISRYSSVCNFVPLTNPPPPFLSPISQPTDNIQCSSVDYVPNCDHTRHKCEWAAKRTGDWTMYGTHWRVWLLRLQFNAGNLRVWRADISGWILHFWKICAPLL